MAKKQRLGSLRQGLNALEDKYARLEIKDKIKSEFKAKGLHPKFIARRWGAQT